MNHKGVKKSVVLTKFFKKNVTYKKHEKINFEK